MITSEKDYPFVECATFADQIKEKGMMWQNNWHFVNYPYLDEGGSVNDFPNFKPDPHTVELAIQDIMDWLMNKGDLATNFVYQNVMNHSIGTEEDGRSFALRLLIHYVGDLHQPLHATARVDSKYPKGDAGGNFFKLPEYLGAKNLHSVWDSVMYLWTSTPPMPFSYGDWVSFSMNTTLIEEKHKITPGEWKNLDIHQWALESFEISKASVYPGIKEGEALPDEYIAKNQDIIQRQIVLGGLRLSNIIQTIFQVQCLETSGVDCIQIE
ncbi:hypothetical protein FGO68_gene13626 [Halteria grandinella]|uniref:S1/P1 nuclease n=1 Tax=Halteria grandinella TaxID=5974 RepID=A0A8J8SVN4_HALGN|nr:hypothetical protein FGO68_gene13626 [Halteria grandinella]